MQCTKDDARTVVQFYLVFLLLSFFSVRFTQQIENPSIIRVMIHQPSSIPYKYKVRIRFSIWDANEIANIRQHIANVYVQRTGQPYSVIMRDLERDTYMSAEESKEFGIIDDVLYPVSDFEINNTDTEDDSDIWYWEDDPYKFRSFREDVEDGEDDPYKFPWPPEFPPRPSPYKFRWPFKFC